MRETISRLARMFSPPAVFETVPPAELDTLLNESFGAAFALYGFTPIGRRRWVRSASAPVREVLVVNANKGGLHTPCWGLSLDFVPHVERGAVRWHRTPRSAYLDLRYDPVDYTLDPGEWGVSAINGLANARRQAASIAAATVGKAVPWFERAVAPGGLPAVFEEQRAQPAVRFGFESYPQQSLALAFVLARGGDPEAARQTLDRLLTTGWVKDEVAGQLRRLLDDAIGPGDFSAPAT